MNLSPGIVGMYRRLGSFGAATLWAGARRLARRAAHHARARCLCWDCER